MRDRPVGPAAPASAPSRHRRSAAIGTCPAPARLANKHSPFPSQTALEEALGRFGRPEIFNTDQGSPFTTAAFTGVLASAGLPISMDGRGRWGGQRLHRTAVAITQARGCLL